MITIDHATERHWPGIWSILEPVFRAGDTYAFPPDISETEARRAWVDAPTATYVATDDDATVLGTYYIKPNHPGPGNHVCNCGYAVAEAARGRGIASAMCAHSLEEAVTLGFRAMQYNLVVATNRSAIHVWEKHGFDIVGTLPGAFQHPAHGFVDAHVMYRVLIRSSQARAVRRPRHGRSQGWPDDADDQHRRPPGAVPGAGRAAHDQ